MTAREVVQKIRENLGVPWNEQTFRDIFKVGNPDVQVKGIATTCMGTFDLIQRCHAAGLNMIVTHEPTFWSDAEAIDLSADPVNKIKVDYCMKNDMVVWRFHDHWHARKPDMESWGGLHGMGLGPAKVEDFKGPEAVYTIPETTLGELALRVRKGLYGNSFRVVGNPNAKVSRIAMGVGSGFPRFSKDVDVVIGGETGETGGADNTGYALDAMALGMNKGLIILGHVVSEEPGMEYAATWLKTFLPGMPIQFIRAKEPFWELS
jgi:putative NIF3 family GTP cyclohydrolase 1 type 2